LPDIILDRFSDDSQQPVPAVSATVTGDDNIAENLRNLMQDFHSFRAASESKSEKLEEEIKAVKISNADLKQENAELRQENMELRQENAELKQSIAELKQSNAELKQSNAELKQTAEKVSVSPSLGQKTNPDSEALGLHLSSKSPRPPRCRPF
jgi:septal ring factor EnvC (AmiA/AmiB activator)